jgi:hypothetical protein
VWLLCCYVALALGETLFHLSRRSVPREEELAEERKDEAA